MPEGMVAMSLVIVRFLAWLQALFKISYLESTSDRQYDRHEFGDRQVLGLNASLFYLISTDLMK